MRTRCRRRVIRPLEASLLLALTAFTGWPARASNENTAPQDALQRLKDSYQRRKEGIRDFTVVTEASTSCHRRVKIGPKETFASREETVIGEIRTVTVYDGRHHWWRDPASGEIRKEEPECHPFLFLENLDRVAAEPKGTEIISGKETRILEVADMRPLLGARDRNGPFPGKLWVDTEISVIRRISFNGEAEPELWRKVPVTYVIDLENYRDIGGMPFPHRIVLSSNGEGLSVPAERKGELEKQLSGFRKGIEELPADQKEEGLGRLLQANVERLEQLLSGKGLQQVTVVKEVRINTGLSVELFEGAKIP